MPTAIAGLVGVLLFNLGAPLVVANFAVSALGVALISTAITVGISFAATALLKPKVPTVKPSDAQAEIIVEVAPRRRSIGTVRIGGFRFFADTDPNQPRELYIGWLLNHGRIGEILEHLVDDLVVTIDGSGEIIDPPDLSFPSHPSSIFFRLGEPVETEYTELSGEFGIEEMRGDGIASVLGRFTNPDDANQMMEIFPNGVPEYKQTNTGSVVFDPREAGHDREDESTWESSENPIVHLFHYAFVDADGYGIPYDWVEDNLSQWTAAMDACEVAVDLNDGNSPHGTEERYRIAMSYMLTEDPRNVAQRMLDACDGRMWLGADGQMHIAIGVFEEPTINFDERHIVGLDLQYGKDRIDAVAGIKAQYMSPDHDYKEQDAEAWPDGDTVAALSEDRVASVDLTQVPSHSQARRLMKRSFIRETGGWHGTVILNLAGLRARDERVIGLQIDALGIGDTAAGTYQSFEVISYEDDGLTLVTLGVQAVDASIDEWDPATEEGTPPIGDPLLETLLDASSGFTYIGDMTGSGGLAGAFDQSSVTGAQKLAATSGYVGLTLDRPRQFKRAEITPTSTQGFVNAAAPNVTLDVYGKTGSAPASATDGTIIGTSGAFADDNDDVEIVSTDRVSQWHHIWIRLSHDGAANNIQINEIGLFV